MQLLAAPPYDPLSDPLSGVDAAERWAVIVVAGLLLLIVVLFTVALARAAHHDAPLALVTVVGLLALVGLLVSAVTQSAAIETITASLAGALAGAVGQQFQAERERNRDRDRDD